MQQPGAHTTIALTSGAMVAFAANSVLCRLALGGELIDAASFTGVRVASGALALSLFVMLRTGGHQRLDFRWSHAAALTGYMLCFSLAYRSIATGTGALILFGSVQLTMLFVAWRGGERLGWTAWAGIALATLGVAYLVAPEMRGPSPQGAALMATAGVCWGTYSVLGRGIHDPLGITAGNFIAALPMTIVLSLPLLHSSGVSASGSGLLLAMASGTIASACGYAVWFAALRRLQAAHAAVVQLSVPVIAGIGGALVLSEPPDTRLVIASGATLGGIWIVLSQSLPGRRRRADAGEL